MTDPARIEIHADTKPEQLTGITVFHCRCGFTLSTADHPRFADYEKARKDHRDACPMRSDAPWPFDRLPTIARRAGGASGASTAAREDGEASRAAAPRSPLLSGRPGWIVRRAGVAW